MISFGKIDINKPALTEEEILNACKLEKSYLLHIIPEQDFFDYVVIKKKNYYQIMASYRQKNLYSYKIYQYDELNTLEQWIPAIYKYLCKIICQQAIENNITDKEEEFLNDILTQHQFKNCIYIIIDHYQYLSESIQNKINIIQKYVSYL